jgi:hypothetical protein
MLGGGSGIETRSDPATVAGFEIGVSSGGAMASDMPAHPPSNRTLPSAARPDLVWVFIGFSYRLVTCASPSAAATASMVRFE